MLRLISIAARGGLAASLVLGAGGCGDGIADNSIPALSRSHAVGQWSPSGLATCGAADHDRYVVSGPDGKLYPTWHPPVDPDKHCSYGHEHGADPRGSALHADVGDVPFGVAAEALDTWDANHSRHDDHEAQKIAWRNGVMLQQMVDGGRVDIGVRCDYLVKMHQDGGAASSGAIHELVYHVRCDDGTEIHSTTLAGTNQPITITAADGAALAFFDPRFDLAATGQRSRSTATSPAGLLMDLCYMRDSSSDEAHSRECQAFPNFKERRLVQFNQTGVYNGGGPAVWYTDPFGAHASTAPFPGSVRQVIAPVTNDRGFLLASQTFAVETAHTSQYLK